MNLHSQLQTHRPIGLADLDSVALMDRYDEKFIVPTAWLGKVLSSLQNHQILTIAGAATTTYSNVYFDTPLKHCLESHTRGRNQRVKVRIRQYENTGVAFLEVKQRDVHGKTTKHRQVRRSDQAWDAPLTSKEREFVGALVPFADNLNPALRGRFERFTLADLGTGERITFDQNLCFSLPPASSWQHPIPHLAVVEWKQATINHQGALIQAFREQPFRRGPLGRALSLSKYILGQHTLDPQHPMRTYTSALRDIFRAETLAANPTFAPEHLLR
ncbi:MAG: polyphosphate polymerase domain-containing protein [Bacteroidetes bacterium]|nr:polyphosphate polymerase domain-containing protein [Bacteroidota bacterium]